MAKNTMLINTRIGSIAEIFSIIFVKQLIVNPHITNVAINIRIAKRYFQKYDL